MFTTSRCSQVENGALAAELPDAAHELHERLLRRVARVLGVAQQMLRGALHAVRMPVTQCGEGQLVSVLGASHENRVGEAVVDERPVGPQVSVRF